MSLYQIKPSEHVDCFNEQHRCLIDSIYSFVCCLFCRYKLNPTQSLPTLHGAKYYSWIPCKIYEVALNTLVNIQIVYLLTAKWSHSEFK